MRQLFRSWCACAMVATSGAVFSCANATEPADGKLVSGIESQYISKTITPGTDFYQYVNEGWLKSTQIPADRSNYGSFSVLEDETNAAIRYVDRSGRRRHQRTGWKRRAEGG